MTIYIDADACPVTRVAEDIARKHGIPVTLLCDTNHQLTSDYSTVKVIGAGADAVDFALINLCKRGELLSRRITALPRWPLEKVRRRFTRAADGIRMTTLMAC